MPPLSRWFTLGDLLQAVHDQTAFDLVCDRFLEPRLEQLAWNFPRTKSRQIRFGRNFVVRFAVVAIDFSSRNRNDHVPFTSAWLVDLNLKIQLGRGLSPAEALKNSSIRLDIVHRIVLEQWLAEFFERFDVIAGHLIPSAKAKALLPARVREVVAPKRRISGVNLENIR
jgi:hypothetical protein